MPMMVGLLLLLLLSVPAEAQPWAELESVPRKTSVRVFEMAAKGWIVADGKLLLVKDNELTILRNGRAFVIPKPVIERVETRQRDPPWEGAAIGALTNIVLGLRGGWQGCTDAKCAIVGIPAYATIGALIDWRIRAKRTVYRAP
jgi:hypothetical protein